MDHDVIIIGATAEGVTAALTGASFGMRVVLVDPEDFLAARAAPSGPFLLSLLRDTVMEIRAAHRVLGHEGTTKELRTLFSRTLASRRRELQRTYHSELRRRLIANGVRVVRGSARLLSPTEVEVSGGRVLRASMIMIATGSRPRRPERFAFDGRTVCDYDSVVAQDVVPRNLVVIGADLVGCEFACMFAALGSNVTLIDRRNRLLRFVDADLRGVLHAWMQRSGVTVVLGEEAAGLDLMRSTEGSYAQVSLASGRIEVSERVLIVAGSEPNTGRLGLPSVGVETDSRGFVSTDDRFETAVRGVYALGGVVDGLASTTMRIHQGRVAMFYAASMEPGGENPTPMVIYTVPEIAMVGLSEEACVLLDVPHVVGCSNLERAPGSGMRGEQAGMMKLVVSRETRRLLGVHVVGTAAAELVGLGAALLRREGSVEEIASTGVSPQSLSEAYHRASLDALTKLGRRARRPGTESKRGSQAF